MSAAKNIAYAIVDGVFDTLNNSVTVSGTTYPVYKAIPETPAQTYVKIGEVIHTEDGSKDTFIYRGSVSISVVDNSRAVVADKKKAQDIVNKIRSLLKTSKGSNPTITGLVQFGINGYTETIDVTDKTRPEVRLTDIYDFIIE